jgi:hypothetical protein
MPWPVHWWLAKAAFSVAGLVPGARNRLPGLLRPLTLWARFAPVRFDGSRARQVLGWKPKHQVLRTFWPLWLILWSALNALFLSGDIFNLYVTLELITFSAVALIGLAGRSHALVAAIRYLIAAMMVIQGLVFRVEAIGGASSFLYGAGGVGGTINVITKLAERREFSEGRLRLGTEGLKEVFSKTNLVYLKMAPANTN